MSRSRSKSKHYAVRVCLLGEAKSGKSSFFYRVKHKAFRDSPEELDKTRTSGGGPNSRTRFYDSYTTVLRLDGNTKINLCLMDTGSRERYQSLTAQYYHRANVIILVCSLDSEHTLNCLTKWHQEAQYYIEGSNVIYAIMATKADLTEVEKEVTPDQLDSLAGHLGVSPENVFQVSSLTGEGVDQALKDVSAAVVAQYTTGSRSLSQELNEATSLLANGSAAANSVPFPINDLNQRSTPYLAIRGKKERTCCGCCPRQSGSCTIL